MFALEESTSGGPAMFVDCAFAAEAYGPLFALLEFKKFKIKSHGTPYYHSTWKISLLLSPLVSRATTAGEGK